jgi:hypothetical protein
VDTEQGRPLGEEVVEADGTLPRQRRQGLDKWLDRGLDRGRAAGGRRGGAAEGGGEAGTEGAGHSGCIGIPEA